MSLRLDVLLQGSGRFLFCRPGGHVLPMHSTDSVATLHKDVADELLLSEGSPVHSGANTPNKAALWRKR